MKAVPISLVSGFLISLALFWLMQMMISNNQQGFKTTDNLQMTEFVRLKRETKLQIKDRKIPDEPPPSEKRPSPPQMQMEQMKMAQSNVPQIDMPNLDIPLQTEMFNGSLFSGLQVSKGEGINQNLPPVIISKVPFHFPSRAANRGIKECWVKFKFTLTELGAVKKAEVIDSKPKKICNKNTLRAFKRYKFRPRYKAGKAVESEGETISITFKR